ncbi:MAG: exonuclease SbcCD subunit D [Eubacteriaceae bacterium]|nr:exonuclease SbcCD subunit D [Eubacteriaceae bacterium]
MKFLHLSDLHLGKRVYGFPMLNEQRHALSQAVSLAEDNGIGAILVSGDVYDRGVPPVEALDAFDEFVTQVASKGMSLFAIAGNHDSPERLAFGRRIMQKGNVHFAGSLKGAALPRVTLTDAYGPLHVYMLPYQRVQDAIDALSFSDAQDGVRRLLLSHQFVTSGSSEPQFSGSEGRVSVGGLDNVDASLYLPYGYVALGHIHRHQKVGRETIRYSGSPLCLSFAELGQEKGALIVDWREKEDIRISFHPFQPLLPFAEISCCLSELAKSNVPREAYCRVVLLDEGPIIDAIGKVRELYPNTMLLEFASQLSYHGEALEKGAEEIAAMTPAELFRDFFEEQCGKPLSDSQADMFASAMAESDALVE